MARQRAAIVRLFYYPDDKLVRREAEALRDAGFAVTVFGLHSWKPRWLRSGANCVLA